MIFSCKKWMSIVIGRVSDHEDGANVIALYNNRCGERSTKFLEQQTEPTTLDDDVVHSLYA